MKLELLTNVTVVDDAIRFVSQKSKAKLKCDEEHKEPNEPDYDEDDDHLEEDQEEEAGEITTNQVF